MKKSLVALAALAVVGAASAQSTVTLYGVADAYFASTKSGVGAASVTQSQIQSGGANGSRWGLKGSEDLGGGLKANFQIESGFNIDDGSAVSGLAFSRQAYVGVSGAFGAVTLGRQYSAYDALRGATNNSYDTALATTGTVWGSDAAVVSKQYSAVVDYTNRVNNSIAFTSANYSGFSGAVVLGLGENKSTTVDATKNVSLNVQYAAGPLLVGYAHQSEGKQNGTAVDLTKYNMLAGSYDLGVVKLTGGYNTATADVTGTGTFKDKEYQLGVNAPIGAAANVAFGYTKATGEQDGTEVVSSHGYTLMGLYDLSKRTRLYAGWNKANAEQSGAETAATSTLAFGMRHSF